MRQPAAYRGAVFEDELKTTHEEYRRLGLGLIVKHEVRRVQSRGRLVYAAKSIADFTGVLKGGRFVAFDAKSLAKPQETWRPDARQAHQLEYLRSVAALGGLAFYLVRNGPDEARVVPVTSLTDAFSVSLAECGVVRRRYGPTPWDWLSVVERGGVHED